MTARDRPGDQGRARGRWLLHEFCHDFRAARRAAGLSQEAVAQACGMSRGSIERLELGTSESLSVVRAAQLAAVVGLDLVVRTYPGPHCVRDVAQLRLLRRLVARLGPCWRWRFEVPIAGRGDQRAWDATATCATTGVVIAVEAITRLRDTQETLRRLALKQRDGGQPRLVVLLAETRANTLAMAESSDILRIEYPVTTRAALRALVAGQDPGANAILVL